MSWPCCRPLVLSGPFGLALVQAFGGWCRPLALSWPWCRPVALSWLGEGLWAGSGIAFLHCVCALLHAVRRGTVFSTQTLVAEREKFENACKELESLSCMLLQVVNPAHPCIKVGPGSQNPKRPTEATHHFLAWPEIAYHSSVLSTSRRPKERSLAASPTVEQYKKAFMDAVQEYNNYGIAASNSRYKIDTATAASRRLQGLT